MTNQLSSFTKEQSDVVYSALIQYAGARDAELSRTQFVTEFLKTKPTSEYRIGGQLGSGGKFRFPAMTVDCYPEDASPSRLAILAACNAELARLRESF